ncbi:peptidylprolyl isomerase fpr4 [Mortierella alpina]|uniref:peptidylprolyl isomerase n=1 Tax=Mortierella alpina TaxID=64518 RepID=A0A9P6M3W5_MORAP|nr:peptidylprolyl isomerase fpr4 [Mortierella alpina]
MLGFWGLTVFPEKTYTQIVENSFKLSMAALDETTKPGRSSIRVTVDNKTFILCSLTAGKAEQQSLDLVFTEGEEITFSVSGANTVHLSGNYLPEDDGMDFDSDEEDMYDDEDMDEDMEEDEEDEDEDEEDEEEDETVIVTKGAKRVAQQAAVPEKKQKITAEQAVKKEAPKKEEPKKKEAAKKEEPKKKEAAKKEELKKEQPKKEEPKKDNKKVLANGLIIEDVKVGTGAAAKSGKKIGMRYIGRLTTGKPFNFNLGRGEVIKGWDLGIQGMMLGGERRLTIPPALAYGAQGAPPDIPRNATLVFEVKLVTLK